MSGRRVCATVPLAVVLLSTSGCGSSEPDERAQVSAYIEQANAVQKRAAPALSEANAVYAAQAKGKLAPVRQLASLELAETALQGTSLQLKELRPPAPAARLQQLLVRVVELNVGLTRQTVRLASYARTTPRVLKPLGPAGRRLGRRLRGNRSAPQQAAAFGSYTQTLDGILRRMGRLEVPSVLRPAHEEQVRRLVATRSLSRRLRLAAADADAPRLARLLLKFGKLSGTGRLRQRTLAKRGLASYSAQLRRLEDARGRLVREQIRLNREVAA